MGNNIESKGNYHFENLTCTDDVELGIYESAFDYAFGNDEIKNIAISGAYGSGKSSVLASYKKGIQKRSLCTFRLLILSP